MNEGLTTIELDAIGHAPTAGHSYQFVGSVGTVDVSVAFPCVGHACAVTAEEARVGWTSRFRTTVAFIRPVTAVDLAVAQPSLLNTLAISASEFVDGAIGICVDRGEPKKN